jgi:exopolysaccharide production protein ExoQ
LTKSRTSPADVWTCAAQPSAYNICQSGPLLRKLGRRALIRRQFIVQAMSPPSAVLCGAAPPSPCLRAHSRAELSFWLLEHLVAVFGLLLCSGALLLLYSPAGAPRGAPLDQGKGLFQIISGSVYLLTLVMLLPRWREAGLLLARNKSILLLLAIAAASFIWAVEPAVALRRALALLLTFGFALWLSIRFAPSALLRLTVVALLLAALASVAVVVMTPEIGKHVWDSHAGLWRGVFGHKNVMGRMMSLAVALGTLLLATTSSLHLLAVMTVGLSTLLVVMSGSATAGATTVLAVMIVPVCRWLSRSRLPPHVVVPVTLGGGILFALTVMALANAILSQLGRDLTLSGRTRLWTLAFDEGLHQPLLGAGFRTFWLEDGPAGKVMGLVSWGAGNIGNGHNGYLDLWLELGLAGVFAYGILLK